VKKVEENYEYESNYLEYRNGYHRIGVTVNTGDTATFRLYEKSGKIESEQNPAAVLVKEVKAIVRHAYLNHLTGGR
jgi:hypothetical protein